MARPARSIATTLLFMLPLLFAPVVALATPSFELTLSGQGLFSPFNVSDWSLANTSTAGESITSFSLSIGDTGYEFDYIRDASSSFPFYTIAPGAVGVSVLAGNGFNGGAGWDLLSLGFSDFDAGEQFDFEVDIDPDGFGFPIVDARLILFNNGIAPNGGFSVGFSDGSSAAVTFPDASPSATSFVFTPAASGSGSTTVPEPGTALLVGMGLVGLAKASRRS